MGFSYELKYRDGGDAGTFVTNLSDWAVGDTFRADGNRPMRITAIIPAELVGEFIEGPVRGVWDHPRSLRVEADEQLTARQLRASQYSNQVVSSTLERQ